MIWHGSVKYLPNAFCLQLDGDIAEQKGGRFAPPLSIPQLKEALEKAAYDPRIRGIHLKIGAVSAGWAKLQVGLEQDMHPWAVFYPAL